MRGGVSFRLRSPISNLHNVFGLHFVAMRHNMDSPLLKAKDVASLGAEIRGLFYGRIFSTSSPLSLILQEYLWLC